MAKYNGYEWSVEQYVELAAAYEWSWWAQMDCCCEPEIASDAIARLFRLAETSRLYRACERAAEIRGVNPPMPVLQGWTVDDYRRSVDLLGFSSWPRLVGLGSVCRRSVGGPDGIIAIVDALDRELPVGVEMHLFGVKGKALDVLHGHSRIRSVDSMAWDMAARRKYRTGRTMARRIEEMDRWLRVQKKRCAGPYTGMQAGLGLDDEREETEPGWDSAATWAKLIADDEIEMQSAAIHWAREDAYVG